MTRVAYLTAQADGSAGWGRYTVEVVRGVRGRGIEPVLITPPHARIDPDLATLEHHPILPTVLARRFSTPRSLFTAPALRRILKTCEIAHCTTELYAPLVALAAPRRMPFVLNIHGTWGIRPLEKWGSRLFFAPAFKRADVVLCLSHFTRRWLARLIELPQAEVLTGGVWVEEYQRSVATTLPDWVGRHKVAFSAGAFKPRKGQHITLEAIALARQHIPDLHYVVASPLDENAPYVVALRRRITELGLENWVHFLGLVAQDALVAWYQQADVFILNAVNDGSSFEGLGMVYLEAAAAGTPAIGSLNCGAEDAIIDGQSGFLVPQQDPQAAADALVKILQDDALRGRLAAGALVQAKRLCWQNLVGRVLQIYETLLA